MAIEAIYFTKKYLFHKKLFISQKIIYFTKNYLFHKILFISQKINLKECRIVIWRSSFRGKQTRRLSVKIVERQARTNRDALNTGLHKKLGHWYAHVFEFDFEFDFDERVSLARKILARQTCELELLRNIKYVGACV